MKKQNNNILFFVLILFFPSLEVFKLISPYPAVKWAGLSVLELYASKKAVLVLVTLGGLALLA